MGCFVAGQGGDKGRVGSSIVPMLGGGGRGGVEGMGKGTGLLF